MSRLLGAIAWAALCAVLIAVSVETTVRADDWSQHGVPFSSGITAHNELLIVDSLGRHARPSAQYRKFRINALGYRGAEVPGETLAAQPVVVIAGASETFGVYESPGHEWPQQLQDQLQAECRGRTPIVLNGAFAGMSLPTVIEDIRRRAARVRPRAVVYYPTPIQYIEGALPLATPAAPVAAPAPPWWRLRSPGRFRDAIKAVIPLPLLDWLRQRDTERQRSGVQMYGDVPMDRLDAFERDLRRLVGAAHEIGAATILVAHRHRFADTASVDDQRWLRAWERFYPRASGSLLLEFDRLAGERTARVARDSGAAFVDPEASLRNLGPAAFADFSHFTDRGAAAMASIVAPAVLPSLACPSR